MTCLKLVKAWGIVGFLALSSFGVTDVEAQQFRFRELAQRAGLSNLSVNCLVEDAAGLIWACTDNGVFRFDGAHFQRFGPKEGLLSTQVFSIAAGPSGEIWAASNTDLFLFDGERFAPVRPQGHALSVGRFAQEMASLGPNEMLVIDGSQLVRLTRDAPGGRWTGEPVFTRDEIKAMPEAGLIETVFVDRTQHVWLGCGTAVCEVADGKIQKVADFEGLPAESWSSFFMDHDGALWVRSARHIAVREKPGLAFVLRDTPDGALMRSRKIQNFVEDGQGRVLTRANSGVLRWTGSRWEHFDESNGLPPSVVTSLVDRDGGVWLGSNSRGLFRWIGYGNWEGWTTAQGLKDDTVWKPTRTSDGRLFISTDAGCQLLEAASTTAGATFTDCPATQAIPPRAVLSVNETSNGDLWYLYGGGGPLYRQRKGASSLELFDKDPEARYIFEDSLHHVYALGQRGATPIGGDASAPPAARIDPADSGTVSQALSDPAGNIWFAGARGLFYQSKDRLTRRAVGGQRGLQGFRALALTADGTLWASGYDEGLLRAHVSGSELSDPEWIADPLVAELAVEFLHLDSRGWLWVGTDNGVAVFDGQVWRRFGEEDGLLLNDTDGQGFLEDTDGSIWIATSGGLSHILHPEALRNAAPLVLRLKGMLQGHPLTDILSATPGPNKEAPGRPTFSWSENGPLELKFTTLNFDEANGIVYRHRLIGAETDWVESATGDVHYAPLQPGAYRLEVVAVSAAHARQSAVQSIEFAIAPPWWRTLWFEILAALAAAAVVIQLWHLGTTRLRRRQTELKQLLERATRDPLTSLWNRGEILRLLDSQIHEAKAAQSTLAVAIIDLDHFKSVNDRFGHQAGDHALQQITARLAASIRGSDYIGRYGGEELLLVLPGLPSRTPSPQLERMTAVISNCALSHGGVSYRLTASFGVTWMDPAGDDANAMIARADAALYEAKDAGRNRVVYAADIAHRVAAHSPPVAAVPEDARQKSLAA